MHKCEFPGCTFTSEYDNDLQYHHIIPQELNGSNDKFNLLHVCQHCHNKIYVRDSHKCSKHYKLRNDSIICHKICLATSGYVLEYSSLNDNELKYHQLDNWRNQSFDKLILQFKEIEDEC